MMADGMRMRQMELQIQQVTTSMAEVQARVETMEDKIGLVVDRKLEGIAKKIKDDMWDQIWEEMRGMREQGNVLCDQLHQFMIMFSDQH